MNQINIDVACTDNKKTKDIRQSAFRATKLGNQIVIANRLIQVLYQNEQFDLANEYNITTSKFVPSKDGVYNLIGTVHFQPNETNITYEIIVTFSVNGVLAGADVETTTTVITNQSIVETVDILSLKAGDIVEVKAISTVAGQFISGGGTRFAVSRITSPTN
ncbi:TPA: hypothetical protein RMI67_006500 [Bacillus cereus]|nr:hypothetical protein [Bacillus cereus]